MYKKLNPFKRKIFGAITNSFKNENVPFLNSINNSKKAVQILITRPNHRLGNQLLLSPLIQEIHNKIPNCEIDLLVNGNLSKVLYENYEYVKRIYDLPKKPFNNLLVYVKTIFNLMGKKYDIGISGCENSNSGKIFLKLSRCNHKIYDSGTMVLDKPVHIAKYPIYNLHINQETIQDQTINYPNIDLKLAKIEIENGQGVLQQLFQNDKKVIALFTYATGNKRLSEEWWQPFYTQLKKEYFNYNLLEILPKENVSQIHFQEKHYYSNDLREIASVIENCVLFIGADSGMMHLAAGTTTPTFGLFHVTRSDIYGPYGNRNMSIDINEDTHVDIIAQINRLLI